MDMTGEMRCAFFDDCICSNDDNISQDDGSKFEEFIATNTLNNFVSSNDRLGDEDRKSSQVSEGIRARNWSKLRRRYV